jgi:hypothetical protein
VNRWLWPVATAVTQPLHLMIGRSFPSGVGVRDWPLVHMWPLRAQMRVTVSLLNAGPPCIHICSFPCPPSPAAQAHAPLRGTGVGVARSACQSTRLSAASRGVYRPSGRPSHCSTHIDLAMHVHTRAHVHVSGRDSSWALRDSTSSRSPIPAGQSQRFFSCMDHPLRTQLLTLVSGNGRHTAVAVRHKRGISL